MMVSGSGRSSLDTVASCRGWKMLKRQVIINMDPESKT